MNIVSATIAAADEVIFDLNQLPVPWVRLFFEYGFFIFIIVSFLLYKLIKISNSLQKTIFAVFIISSFFLDVMFSPLLMGFTGFILGLARNRNKIFKK